MQIVQRTEALVVVGWPLRTNNERAFEDIPAHWARFTAGGGLAPIASRRGDDVYAVYTEFAHPGVDNLGDYTLVIGAAVADDVPVPSGLARVIVPAGREAKFEVERGHPEQVGAAWRAIWARQDIEKAYVADHEHYRPDGHIAIHVGLRR